MHRSYPIEDMPRMPPRVDRVAKPAKKGDPPDPSLFSKFEKARPVKLKFDEDEIAQNPTNLEEIVCSKLLPQLVQVTEEFEVDGNVVGFKAGQILMLHMIVEREVVHAVDKDGRDLYLPIQSEQVYERLTIDERVDDRLYIGVEALLKANILPPMVRVIENYYSADPTECVDDEDLLELYRVDVAPEEKRHRGRMCVYGKNQQGYNLNLHQGMTTAHFTTKLSANLHPMTEIIQNDFPQRVRIPSSDPTRPNIKAEKIIKLLGVEKEYHVIMTIPGKPEVFGIPSKIPIKMTLATGNFRHVAKSLPPMYALVNPTWHIDIIGRSTLQPQFRQFPQPAQEILQPWLSSFEGKECVQEAAKVNEMDIKRQIVDLKNEVDMWKNLYETVKTSTPEVPKRLDVPIMPPARPPKPNQKVTTPPKLENKPSFSSAPKKGYTSIIKSKMMGIKLPQSPKMLKTAKSPTSPPPQQSVELDYEQPIDTNKSKLTAPSDDEDDLECYEEIDDITNSQTKKMQELKRTLDSQLQMIEAFRKQETGLKKELREAKSKNEEHVHHIYSLQQEIDSLLNKDEDIYDTISEDRPLPVPPSGMPQNIYNSPAAGMTPGMKVCADQLQTYTVAGVEKFLKEIKLEKHATSFRLENIDGPLLLALDEQMLKELGMSALDARKLCVRIGKMSSQ
ncbi:uncharacterized protein [Antedon mediterranea]|uniref:uncharacterized protein n=1 Tax=Antedon mediterranea TaxID=105859 RepID=UPI003AF8C233